MSNPDQKLSLPFHEKFAAWLIVSTIVFLSILNIRFDDASIPETDSKHHLVNPLIEISIEGAVAIPGTYQIKKGTPMRKVLEMAKPLPEANLSRIKLDNPINRRRVIKIPSRNANPKKEHYDEKNEKKVL